VSSELLARLRSQHGNTMLLMPAAVLVLFVLAAIAVDAAVLFLGQRRLADLAASVAQDAVAAVDEASFYDEDRDLALDVGDARAREATLTSALPRDDALLDPSCGVEAGQGESGPVATVSCTARVRFVFTPVVPGTDRLRQVSAHETAVGRQR
jgi:Flp pilus assembly protein TadG